MKFDLVDKVIEVTSDRIVTVKNVSSAEEYLADHFPSFPVLPGVMMMEAMVQASRRWLEREGPAEVPWVLAEVRNVRYGNMVRPGQQLKVTVEKIKDDEAGVTFKGTGEVEGQTAVQGRFVMRPAKIN